MLKKEISDVLKQTAIFIVFLFALPAFLVFTKIIAPESQPYFSVFFPIFQFGLLFWAFFMGVSLFSVERGQSGMEYLLSLPFSRYKLIGLKILPRLISVLLFYVVFLIIFLGEGHNYAALSLVSFTTIYFSFYLISLSLSASSNNFLVLFVVSLLSLFIYLRLGFFIFWLAVKANGYIYYELEVNPFITGELDSFIINHLPIIGICMLIPLLAAFGLSLKRFDIRPSKVFNTRFIKFFTPLIAFGLLVSFFFAYKGADVGYSQYYLTRNHKLIEQNYYFGLRIYDGKNVHKIKERVFYFNFAAEDNQYVYGITYSDKIFGINTSDYSVDILYEAPRGKRFMWGRYLIQQRGFQKDEKIMAFMERKRDYSERTLVLLFLNDKPSKRIKRIPLDTGPTKEYYSLRIFAADQSGGNNFWLATAWKHPEGTNIFRLWEDGRIESIGPTQKFPVYINGLLITYSENEILLNEEKNGQFETVRRIPNPEDYLFGYGFWEANLFNAQTKEVYGRKYRPREELKKGPMWARLDLETFEIEELNELKGWLHCIGPDEFYFEEKNYEADTFKIYRFQDGQSKLIKSFRISFKETFYPYEIFKSGVVLRRGKKVKVYAFPDLREIKFKKL
jgi:hypothetical protein